MNLISAKEYAMRQPWYPQKGEHDNYYLELANNLYKIECDKKILQIDDLIVRRIAMGVADFMQDIVADAGIWRSFINCNRALYNKTLPFFEVGDDYVDYEINFEDVRFLIWYTIAMFSTGNDRLISPHAPEIEQCARLWFDILEDAYEDAPVSKEFLRWREIDLKHPYDNDELYHFANWLFLHCYLMVPAASETFNELIQSLSEEERNEPTLIQQRIEQLMMESPTGPTALFTNEWINLILEDKMPDKEQEISTDIHPYYDAFIRYTGGKEICFFSNYKDMNDFFIKALGWEEGTEHLPQMKDYDDYVLLVNKHKGMLAAKNVCRCISAPDNPLYDKEYARRNAIHLFTKRGACPADLVKYAAEHHWLDDARFPSYDNGDIVPDNYDFISRCYLQLYYRD